MNAANRERFERQAQEAAEENRPGRVQIDGSPWIRCSVTFRTQGIELDRGRKTTRSVLVTVLKSRYSKEPPLGKELLVEGESTPFEIYETGGHDLANWSIRGAFFPESS